MPPCCPEVLPPPPDITNNGWDPSVCLSGVKGGYATFRFVPWSECIILRHEFTLVRHLYVDPVVRTSKYESLLWWDLRLGHIAVWALTAELHINQPLINLSASYMVILYTFCVTSTLFSTKRREKKYRKYSKSYVKRFLSNRRLQIHHHTVEAFRWLQRFNELKENPSTQNNVRKQDVGLREIFFF